VVLMVPPLLSHYSLEDRGQDEKVGRYCGDGLLGYGDEVRVSCVWEEGGGRVKIAWIHKGMCKAPDHLISKNASQRKKAKIMVIAC